MIKELLPAHGNGPYRVLRAFSGKAISCLESSLTDPQLVQEKVLKAVLNSARGTGFARDHGLEEGLNLDAFRQRVPVRSYSDGQAYFDRVVSGEPSVLTRHAVKQLLVTSGTTGPSKFLPVTSVWEKEVAMAQDLWRLGLVKDREEISRGKVLTLVSPAVEGRLPSGLTYGSNTGRMHARQPWMIRMRYPTPDKVHQLSDPILRLYCTLRFALQSEVSSITTANPSTILMMARRLEEWSDFLAQDLSDGTLRCGPATALEEGLRTQLERKSKRRVPPTSWKMADLWNLVSIHCWKGGAAGFYLDQFPRALGGEVPIREVGITASEGYFALPLSDEDPGGIAWLGAHLLEFLTEDDEPRWAWELEEGGVYRLVISTTAGLYRYDLGDLVEVVGFAGPLPRLRFLRKSAAMLNVTGEKVSQEQIIHVVESILGRQTLVGFTARTQLQDPPRVELALEWVPGQQREASGLADRLDQALRQANIEYDSKRKSERLGPLTVRFLSQGSYARYRLARASRGAPDSQVKDLVVAWRAADWDLLMESARS
jgi:hypothetical protein